MAKKTTKYIIVSFSIVIFAIISAGCNVFNGSVYTGPKRPHFDGEYFSNNDSLVNHGFWQFLQWQMTSDRGPWPRWVDIEQKKVHKQRAAKGEIIATFVNHSTVLLQFDSLNILTDPVWSERVSPVSFAGPERRHIPGIKFEDLPEIDIVLISHNHYDHLDIPTLKRLEKAFAPRYYVPLGNSKLLNDNGIKNVTEMDWWESINDSSGLEVNFVPARHFSGRGLSDRNKTLWGGFVIIGRGGPVYYVGDTGWGRHFSQIAERFPAPRLTLIPIGAYKPRWFMHPHHISPLLAVYAHKVLNSEYSIPVHYGTFQMADESYHDQTTDFVKARDLLKVSNEEFPLIKPGDYLMINQERDISTNIELKR